MYMYICIYMYIYMYIYILHIYYVYAYIHIESDPKSIACGGRRGSSHAKQQRVRPNLVPCPNLVFFASTTVCCAGRSATRYRAARETLPRVPTAFQGSKCVRGGLKQREYQVKALYQVRANACHRVV